ncbi:uncharacterized protein LOC119079810 [Bradysia coprophila]|uniref:uncharacterized protein LOC119079810 n=1 Tax=Bradysia coprophila TaxID=38358 RepID=UPI00187DC219|nr:uncharacterized protein LOC119079810 [Bradysia coprophila]
MQIYFGLFLLATVTFATTAAKDGHQVHCSEDWMKVDIILPSIPGSLVYLEGMKGYPNPKCQPESTTELAQFKLSLKDFYECGVTRVVNKITGKKVFYHKIIVESADNKEFVSVKCITTSGPVYNVTRHSHSIATRSVLPPGFEEPIDLDITTSLTEYAPEPTLNVGVRQGGEIVTGELNVSPGTPLAMEIYLDKQSAPVYGLGVTYMQVTDTKSQEETIIFNGCSVDPYLFDNFNTVDGDFLSAKFRAFKFPESTYVQFRGSVNVCLDKCKGIQCSNGQIGYGRRKREIASSVDPNKVYEISMTTFIKVTNEDGADPNAITELEEKLVQLKIANQKLPRNSRGSSVFESVQDHKDSHLGDSEAIVEETTIFRTQTNGAHTAATLGSAIVTVSVLVIKFIL